MDAKKPSPLMQTILTPDIVAIVDPIVVQLKRRQITGDRTVALAVAHLLMRVISAARWNNPNDLISVLRKVGTVLHKARPRDVIAGNIVRRVLALVRDEFEQDAPDSAAMMSSMFSLLSTTTIRPQTKKQTSDMRSVIIQGIRDLIDEISTVKEELESVAADLIHENEVLLAATPVSDTVVQFLLKARAKRNFTVLVAEGYPNDIDAARLCVRTLADHKIEAVLIPDSAVFAIMSRVGKVLVGALAVFANGGCLSTSGVANVVECAKEHRTPVIGLTGLYKLSPTYPFNRGDLVEMGGAGKVVDYAQYELVENVDMVTNPLADYVAPENIDIYITNVGGFAPSFIYRIVLDNYKPEDNNLEDED